MKDILLVSTWLRLQASKFIEMADLIDKGFAHQQNSHAPTSNAEISLHSNTRRTPVLADFRVALSSLPEVFTIAELDKYTDSKIENGEFQIKYSRSLMRKYANHLATNKRVKTWPLVRHGNQYTQVKLTPSSSSSSSTL